MEIDTGAPICVEHACSVVKYNGNSNINKNYYRDKAI